MVKLIEWSVENPVASFFIWGYALIISFLCYCSVSRVWAVLRPEVKLILAPLLVLYCVDVIFNLVFGSIMFMELPRTLTFTARCDTHLKGCNWQGKLARYICKNMLNTFQPDHCS